MWYKEIPLTRIVRNDKIKWKRREAGEYVMTEKTEDIQQVSLKSLLHTFKTSGDRYCFILGSGASVESGIPTGQQLAKKWYQELQERYTEQEIAQWQEKIGFTGGSKAAYSKHYFDIYQFRFQNSKREGNRALIESMEDAHPSSGYYPLTRLMSETRHNLVITTNFDSMTEDALFIYTGKKPMLVGHEALAQYLEPTINRPTVLKIHHDLFLDPQNTREQIEQELCGEWREALIQAFRFFTPIVIGYAGGDHTLMGLLRDPSVSIENIFWCYRDADELTENEDIRSIVKQRDGKFVQIRGFDDMMFRLGMLYEYENPGERLRNEAENRCNMYNAQIAEFEQELNERIELDKDDLDAHSSKAYILLQDGKYEEAVQAYTEIIEQNPNYVVAYFYRGNAYCNIEQHNKAIEDYSKAIALDPQYVAAFNNRGVAYRNIEQYDKAVEDYSKAIELDPQNAAAFYNRGIAYDEMKQYNKAVENYSKAITLDPQNAVAYYNRGNIYCNIEQYNKAIEDYNKAIELDPQNAAVFNNRGNAYCNIEQYDKAIEDYSKAIELDPQNAGAFYNRGVTYKKIGKRKKAKMDFAMAKKLEQQDITYKQN